ncbi:hypothetical protein C481_01997 [Natrialba asiatica DSM 12278]|uniref:Uncharacterized protein n=1 Tax=Natrialba asiatica (strain ATCC 700177 / DSM 12278 / JCM 9576 / FERM P-10747 / NBRC 102637 / 172P1) TaxID=29540 RepID=M0B4K5_NATA1|nr:hypothetical protein C481_01997 [Natrialba asiatica DSM 12278]
MLRKRLEKSSRVCTVDEAVIETRVDGQLILNATPSDQRCARSRISMRSTPRIAISGGVLIGVNESTPKTPGFETVNVPPRRSRIEYSPPERARSVVAVPLRVQRGILNRDDGVRGRQPDLGIDANTDIVLLVQNVRLRTSR